MIVHKLKVGDSVWFKEEVKPYIVRAISSKFAILTKPFNLRKTYFYTIIDLKDGVRSSDDRLFSDSYLTDSDCIQRLDELNRGVIKLSLKEAISCTITRIVHSVK